MMRHYDEAVGLAYVVGCGLCVTQYGSVEARLYLLEVLFVYFVGCYDEFLLGMLVEILQYQGFVFRPGAAGHPGETIVAECFYQRVLFGLIADGHDAVEPCVAGNRNVGYPYSCKEFAGGFIL